MFGYKLDGAALLGEGSLIVGGDEDVGVEKATSGHGVAGNESRLD
jgi:hypothetical protein